MSHLTPYTRMTHPNMGTDMVPQPPPQQGASNPKKRRKNQNTNNQGPSSVQDLLPPPLSGFGDTIIASNPFDDCPQSMSVNSRSPNNPMGMGPGMNPMGMCRPMGSGMMGSPNQHMMPNSMMMQNQMNGGPMNGPPMGGPSMNGPPMNGPPMNGPMGPNMTHPMMGSPNGPMQHGRLQGPNSGPMSMNPNMGPMSVNGTPNMPPMNNMSPMNTSPMHNPMNGPPNNGMNGPMGSMNGPMNGQMNSPMNGPMNGPNQGMHCPPNNNFMMNPMNMYPKPMPVSAGKIYPADQPMVFNAQNPNAPPIYPCGVCHKEVHDNDQAILCESGCNFWYHRGCTGLTEAAFQLLTQEVYAEWVCDKCLSSKNIPLVKFKP